MRYESADWWLDVPEGWCHESDDDCTTFEHPQGVGAFQVSSYTKGEFVTDEDLLGFAGEIPLKAVSLERFTGFRAQFCSDDRVWIKWWMRAGRQMIHVTYNCARTVFGREDAAVSSMIETLSPK